MRRVILAVALVISAAPLRAGDFSGWYAGGGIAVGTSKDRVFPDYSGSYMDSPSALAFGGFNFTYGDFVFGPEVSLRANVTPQTVGKYDDGRGLYSTRATYEEAISPTFSLRAGIASNNLLFYGRAGVGVSHIKWVGEEWRPYSHDRDTDHIDWRTLSGAIGAEYNFERMFVRVEAEVRKMRYNSEVDMLEYQASTAVGIRF